MLDKQHIFKKRGWWNLMRSPCNSIESVWGKNVSSPDAMSTRMFFCWVTLMCAVTFPSFRANSSIPSAKELNRSRPLGFQVRNWNPTDTILWSLLPGSCRKLVPLKKTGNVCVSTQENVRLRWKWGRKTLRTAVQNVDLLRWLNNCLWIKQFHGWT